MIIHTFEQGTHEWFEARKGIPTASRFGTVLASGVSKGEDSKTRTAYLHMLAGEIITGQQASSDWCGNEHTERGKEMEAEVRSRYAFTYGVEPVRVGLVVDGRKGCSPDCLIGDDGIAEFKTTFPQYLIPMLLKDEFPPKFKAQCQGGLWVCKREWVDINVYWPNMPVFTKRAVRDEKYIATLASEVNRFNDEIDAVVARIRGMMPAPAVAA